MLSSTGLHKFDFQDQDITGDTSHSTHTENEDCI